MGANLSGRQSTYAPPELETRERALPPKDARPIVTLAQFFGAFRESPSEVVYFRAIKAKDCPPHLYRDFPTQENPPSGKNFLVASYSQLEPGSPNVKTIEAENQRRGAYFAVNAGGVKDVNITGFRAAFGESDPKPGEDIEAFLAAELQKVCPLQPSVELVTYKSVHRHWLITGPCSREEWIIIQQGMIAHFGSDPTISNEERVMRFPNSNHVRVDFVNDKLLYKPIELVIFEPARRYTVADLQSAFPCPDDGYLTAFAKLSQAKYKAAGVFPSEELKAKAEAIKTARKTRRKKNSTPEDNGAGSAPKSGFSNKKTTTLAELIERQKNGETLIEFKVEPADYSDGEFQPEEIKLIEGTIQRQCWRMANAADQKKHATLWECALILGGLINGELAERDRLEELLLEAVGVAGQNDPNCDLAHAGNTIDDAFGKAEATTLDELRERTWVEEKPQSDVEFYASYYQDIIPLAKSVWIEIEKAERQHPRIFWYGDVLSRLTLNKRDFRIEPLTPDTFAYRLAYLARWFTIKTDKNGNRTRVFQPPPGFLVKHLMAAPVADTPVPGLNRITDIPVFDRDGDLIDQPGFHHASGIFYNPAFYIEPIPERVSVADVNKAKDLLLRDLLVDFPFAGAGDKHNAIGALLTPFVREMIIGPTPMILAEASLPRSGKGLLIESILTICFGGKEGYEMLTYTADEKEMSKRITAALIAGKGGVLIDNIKDTIDSGDLCSALTATHHSGRILGASKLASVPVSCLWTATANNPSMSNEMAGRIISVRLLPNTDRPEERTGFTHPELQKWVAETRPQLVRAALVLCKAWLQKGKPRAKSKNHPAMGRYESFVSVVGGILENAGFDQFMANRASFTDRADTGRTARAILCHECFNKLDKVPGQSYTQATKSSEIWEKIGQHVEGLDLPKAKDPRLAFGHYLKASVDILPGYFGPADDTDNAPTVQATYRIVLTGKKTGGSRWYQVERLHYAEQTASF